MTFAFAAVAALFNLSKTGYMTWKNQRIAKQVHHDLLTRVMNAPINLFFDTTSLGRITVRFSNDIEIFKGGLQGALNVFANNLGKLLAPVAFLLFLSKWSVLFLAVIGYMFVGIIRPILYAKHQIESVGHRLWSPTHALRQECLKGSSVIRAFQMQENFQTRMKQMMDKTTLHFIACESCE